MLGISRWCPTPDPARCDCEPPRAPLGAPPAAARGGDLRRRGRGAGGGGGGVGAEGGAGAQRDAASRPGVEGRRVEGWGVGGWRRRRWGGLQGSLFGIIIFAFVHLLRLMPQHQTYGGKGENGFRVGASSLDAESRMQLVEVNVFVWTSAVGHQPTDASANAAMWVPR